MRCFATLLDLIQRSLMVYLSLIIDALLFSSTSTVATVLSNKMQRFHEPDGYQAELPGFHCGG